MKPNVILIMTDQMRGDCLGVKGHPVVETPNLDMMARNGILFNRAYSAVPSCIAARCSLMTGLMQRTHGRVGYQDMVPWNYECNLAGEFSKAGYHTQAIGKMHVYPTRNLFGFHNVLLHNGYMGYNRKDSTEYSEHWNTSDDYIQWLKDKAGIRSDIVDTGLNCNSWVARPWNYDENLHPTNWVVTEAIDFLRRRDPTKPFFEKLSFVRPHSPLDPPKFYYDQYINQDIPLPPVGDWADTEDAEKNGLEIDAREGIISNKALKRARAAYYALITHIDHQIGRYFEALRESGELENSIILFVSDHGDMLGDHNLFRKAVPYEGSTLVPLILYDPGNILKCNKGSTVEQIAELRDIMPTLLDLSGNEVPQELEGKSLKPLIYGDECEWREYIHGEHSYGAKSNHFIVTEKDKYIWYSQTGEEQYFNLAKDPDELHNLVDDKSSKDRVDYLRRKLIEELKGREEGYTNGNKLIAGRQAKACLDHIL